MLNIKIYITYFEDGTSSVREIYINKKRAAKFEPKLGKIDLGVLKPYEGCAAEVISRHINNVFKNNTKMVIIKEIEQTEDGNHIAHFDGL